jgi:hypothetical protein
LATCRLDVFISDVDHAARGGGFDRAECHDAPITDSDAAAKPGVAAAIQDACMRAPRR